MDLKLQVLLQMLDKASAPLRRVQAASKASGDTLRKTRDALRALDKTQQAVGEFRKLKEGARANAMRQRELQQQIAATAREMRASDAPSTALARQFKRLTTEARGLKAQEDTQLQKLQQLRQRLAAAGINTANLGSAERRLRGDMASTTASIDQQTAALRRQGEQVRRAKELREQLGKTQAAAAHLSVAGYASLQGGRHLVAAVSPMLDQGKQYQQHIAQMRAQGASAADIAMAERFANSDTTRGSSINDKLEILKDANSIFRDMHEAVAVAPQLLKAKYTFEALMAQHGQGEGHGEETVNQLIDAIRTGELRNATTSPAAFNQLLDTMTRAYVGSGGLVKPSDYLEAMKVGGVATKQMDEKALFFGAMHTIQEMGGMRSGTGFATAYQNWAAGRSTQQAAEALASLGLVNKDAVKYGKTGHITKLLPGALVNQQLYEANPFEYLMKEVIPRINPQGKLSDEQVVSKLNALFSGRKGGDLFVGMFMQRANIAKQLAASERFASLDDSYRQTGATAQGEEVDLLAKKRDLYLQLGTQLLPVYVAALEKVVAITGALSRWAKVHPVLAKGLTVTAAALGVLLVGAGGLMVALGGILGPIGLIRFALGASSGGALTLAKALGGGLVTAIRLVGTVIARVGLLMLANPILLVIAAIAGAAYLIWRNWDKIKPYLLRFWSWVSDKAAAAWEAMKAAWSAVKQFFGALWEAIKAPFIAGFQWIGDKLDEAEGRWKKLKEALSGGAVGTALAVATDSKQSTGSRWKAGLLGVAALGMAAVNPAAAAPLLVGSKPAITSQAPLRAGGAGGGTTTNNYNVSITAMPGHEQAAARAASAELDRRERAKAAQRRSALADHE
jgi:hypothetical protein